MSCLHPFSDSSLRLSSRLIMMFCLVLYLLPLVAEGAPPQNVSLEFPVFNSTMFACTGIPSIVAYPYCVFNSSGAERAWVSVLPPTYNNIYPNQAARMMYRTPISFRNVDSSIIADWSTFMIFTVEQVVDQLSVGSGLAFLIAPEIDTPTDSASGGFGLFPMNPSTGQPVSGTKPMVIAVEFDTQMTDGIDVLDVPHLGIDLSSLVSVNATTVGTEFYDNTVGIWVDYNNTLKTLAVYCTQVDAADGTAAALKPSTPSLSLSSFSSVTYMNQQAYIGISAGVFGGGFEVNKVVYWTFKTFGFPTPIVVATWYQWWKGVSTTKKMGLIAGAVVGTIAGAYACSECLFFCFFQRIKHPATAAEQRWPVRRRTSLPGTKPKQEPPRRKVRDSLSVAKPLHLWSTPPVSDGEPAVDFSRRPESDLKAMAEFDDLSDSEGSQHAAQDAFDNDFGDLGLPLDQSLDEHVQDPAAVGTPEEAEKPGKAEEAPPPGSSPAEVKARPPVAEKPGKAEEAPEKKPEAQAGTKTETKDKPLIEKKPSQPGKEAPAPSATKVPPGAVNPSSPSKPRPVPSAEKPGAPPVAKPGSPPQEKPSQAPKTVAAQAAKPGSPPQEKPSQAGKTVAPQVAKPVLPQERPSQAPGKTVSPQAPKPSSPLLPQRSSQVGKTVAPQTEKPGSAPQERPSPTGKTVAPPATKPGSPPQEKPAPVDKKMAPQTAKPGSPQVAKPDSPPQEKPGKTVAPQATKPGSEPQHGPSPVDKTAAPQAAKPGSPPEQQKPSQPGKTAAPQATKPGSPLMPGPWQGEKAKPEAGPQKVAPQAVEQTPPPAGATVAQQKSPPQAAGPSQAPRKELPKAPRPSPQTSPPKAASPQTSPKAVPRPTPQSPPKK